MGKFWNLLTRRQRLGAIVLVGLMMIGMALEMIGIGLVVPALVLMTRPDFADSQPWVRDLLARMGNPGRGEIVVAGMLVLVAVYAVKAVFLAYMTWKQMKFIWEMQADLSQRLFGRYLHQPYAFHLRRNSAQLIGNAVNEVLAFAHLLLAGTLQLLSEGLVLLGVAAVLIVLEPFGALVIVLTVGALAWGFYLLTHRAVLRWGEGRQLHERLRLQHIQQGLGGVKDVLLLGREREFLEQYRIHNVATAQVGHKQQALSQMPRLGLELCAVIALTVLVIVMLNRGSQLEAILPALGLFAAAGFRIMPSVNRVIIGIQNARYALPAIQTLHEELSLPELPQEPTAHALPFDRELRLSRVTYTYEGASRPALQDVSLSIARGTTVGFIGGSGAGKSTLVDVLLGLLPPDSGSVEVDGVDIATQRRAWQRDIGYVPQSIFLTDESLRRNIAFGIPPERIDDRAVFRALKAAQLEDFVASLPEGVETTVGERGVRLSGGQLQRIGIARALYHDPAVLVLDEATSSLDSATERSVMQSVGALRGQKTIIIVAHRLSTLEDCDWVYRLEGARLVDQGGVDRMIGPHLRAGTEGSAVAVRNREGVA